MRKINVNIDLNDFKRMMSKYLKGITFDEVSWETVTDSEGNEDDYFDYPSQRSTVAQQVANQYLDK